jgi:hypothetical protein
MRERVLDILDDYKVAVRRTESAAIAAASCTTRRDFERHHKMEEAEYEAQDQTITKLMALMRETGAV